MLPSIAGAAVALAGSGVFSTTELALSSVSEARMRTLLGEGFRGSAELARLQTDSARIIILLRLGQLAGLAVAALLAGTLATDYGLVGWLVALGALGLSWLFFCYLFPTKLAAEHGVRISLLLAPVLLPLWHFARPLISWALRPVSPLAEQGENHGAGFTESELRQLTALGRTEGLIEEQEGQLVERAFRLDEMRAWDVMTPRVDIFAWRDSLSVEDIAAQLSEVPFSRVPVYGDSIDDVTGVLHIRDAYQALVSGESDRTLREMSRQPFAVPGSVRLTSLLRGFQTRRVHMAIVLDEYGGTDGLATLEDVIEELVGDIVDETDVDHEPIIRVSADEIVAAGDAELREINALLRTNLPQSEHRSLNGYLLEELGRVPEAGEKLAANGVMVEVLEATEVQVQRAKVVRRSCTVTDKDARPEPKQARGDQQEMREPKGEQTGGDNGPAVGEERSGADTT